MKMKRCPKCGNKTFSVTAHVTQDWVVDEYGNFNSAITECVEVTHKPDDSDIWGCMKCGHSAPGRDFNVPGTEND